MSDHPLNLAVRFLLELVILFALGAWGWHKGEGAWRWLLMPGLPVLAGALWGIFRVPGDPGAATVAIPGYLRLGLELVLFGSAVWALYDLGWSRWATVLLVVTVVHYLVSYDRVGWLLGR